MNKPISYEDIKFSTLRSVLATLFISPEEFMEFVNKKSVENFTDILEEEKQLSNGLSRK